MRKKACSNCWLLNHFSKNCRKPNKQGISQFLTEKLLTGLVEELYPEDSVNYLQSSANRLYKSDYSSGENNMAATTNDDLEKFDSNNMAIKIGNISITPVDSGSILNNSIATRLGKRNPQAKYVIKINKAQLRASSIELIQIEGKIRTTVTSNGWHILAAEFTVVADGIKQLIFLINLHLQSHNSHLKKLII